ncbi:ABC transporter ATP-binding protein [Spiroplasma turonicum]|uniref:ABC transporter ATP-binding protein/permease n=1 Tax=Spiroplasma turonicum TaxID=216946 RepID=A0A0K1P6F3_9MOLU|nr:ABC transporter ATP-binding protein/permease [Spiroplasma turonicum]AKU79452.1 ABC transporter ATP-binding protein/permease [Spiroplasma turonicum]ALX70474.1 ABC transporter ATP-binding protein [Spiroplasma turonicum]
MQSVEDRVKFFSKDKLKKYRELLAGSIKAYPGLFTIYVLLAITDTSLFSSMSIVIANLIKNITNEGGKSLFGFTMYWYSWVAVGWSMILAYAVTEFFFNYVGGIWTRKVEIWLRVKCLKALVDVDLTFYSKNQIGNYMTKIIGDSQGAADGLNEWSNNLIYIIIMFIVINIIMFSLNVEIAAIAIGVFVLLLIISLVIYFQYRKATIVSLDYKQNLDADNTDRLMNIRLIKSSGTELSELERIKDFNKIYAKKINKTVWLGTLLLIFANFLGWILPGLITISIIFMYNDTYNLAQITALVIPFVSTVTILAGAMFLLPIILRALSVSMNCNWRLNFIYSQKSIIIKPSEPIKVNQINKIELKNVEFIYPESPSKLILPKTSLVFEKGKSYAFVGETGSGKSTIAKLLLRFYDPYKGDVLINDINLKEIDMPSYLDKIGYVEQEPQILYGTVMDNIRYAKFDATDEEVIEAAKKASLHNFILTLSDKYDTILGERGFIFSGGQKQRLVIARMFLKNPELLILDEATSALDNIVEKEVQAQLDKLIIGRTTIIIAHRLSTIKDCDQIIVLGGNAGGIVQVGTFEELKNLEGHFNKLYKAGLMG